MRACAVLLVLLLQPACSRDGLDLPVGDVPDGGSVVESTCGISADTGSAGADLPVLAFGIEHELRLLLRKGDVTVAHRFAEGAGVDTSRVRVREVQSRDGWLVAAAFWTPFDGSNQYGQELALLDRQGRVVWTRRFSGGAPLGPELGAGGLSFFAADRSAVVVDGGGRERAVPRHSPLGGPLADGTLAVAPLALDELTGYGFLRPDGTTLSPLTLPLWSPVPPRWMGDRLVYLGDRQGRAVLVLERPDGATVLELDVTADRERRPSLAMEGRFGLLTTVTDSPPRQLRLDVDAAALSPVTVGLPPGVRLWHATRPQIDDTGSLTVAGRDDYRGAIYTSTSGTGAWSRIGLTIAQALRTSHAGRGGTFLVSSHTMAFGGETEWPDPPPGQSPDLTGDSVHVARPASALAYRLPSDLSPFEQWYSITPDGRCLAWSSAPTGNSTEWRVRTLEVESRRTHDAARASSPNAVGAMAWFE